MKLDRSEDFTFVLWSWAPDLVGVDHPPRELFPLRNGADFPVFDRFLTGTAGGPIRLDMSSPGHHN